MPLEQALFTLLHVLVFVYWLGGDLGAFYASRFLTADDVSTDRKLLAAKIVGDVDMAPRTALILALPTGLILARQVGYIDLDWIWIGALSATFLVWLGLAWKRHLSHGSEPAWMRVFDLAIRWITLAGLIAIAMASFMGHADWPLFLALKSLALALAIAMGLAIRVVLKPLGPAIGKLIGDTPEQGTAELKSLMGQARPLVLVIWACLLSAAFLGLWKPV